MMDAVTQGEIDEPNGRHLHHAKEVKGRGQFIWAHGFNAVQCLRKIGLEIRKNFFSGLEFWAAIGGWGKCAVGDTV